MESFMHLLVIDRTLTKRALVTEFSAPKDYFLTGITAPLSGSRAYGGSIVDAGAVYGGLRACLTLVVTELGYNGQEAHFYSVSDTLFSTIMLMKLADPVLKLFRNVDDKQFSDALFIADFFCSVFKFNSNWRLANNFVPKAYSDKELKRYEIEKLKYINQYMHKNSITPQHYGEQIVSLLANYDANIEANGVKAHPKFAYSSTKIAFDVIAKALERAC
jgi:hypothetical protein